MKKKLKFITPEELKANYCKCLSCDKCPIGRAMSWDTVRGRKVRVSKCIWELRDLDCYWDEEYEIDENLNECEEEEEE